MNNLATAISNSRDHWHQALEECEQEIEKWRKHEEEYVQLKERLELFPRQLSHDVMVPLGKVALMPGQLVHTNRVMVMLGDNWFAMRSAYQAQEIADRRLKYINETIKKYEQQRQLYIERLEGVTKLLNEDAVADYFEIREPVKAEEEDKERRRIRMAHQPTTSKGDSGDGDAHSSNTSGNTPKKISEAEFTALMDRLDQLGREEEEEEEENEEIRVPTKSFSKCVNHPCSATLRDKIRQQGSNVASSTSSSRKVVWQDHIKSDSSVVASSDTAHPFETADGESSNAPPKSILKNRDEVTPVGELPASPYEQRPKIISPVTEEVFRETVVERIPGDRAPSQIQVETSRPKSRFAQERAASRNK